MKPYAAKIMLIESITSSLLYSTNKGIDDIYCYSNNLKNSTSIIKIMTTNIVMLGHFNSLSVLLR